MDTLNNMFPTREDNEQRIKDFAEFSGIIDITPHIHTHLGRVTMLDSDANLIEEVAGDWCIQGTLQQLTDEEFTEILKAVKRNAEKVLSSVASK